MEGLCPQMGIQDTLPAGSFAILSLTCPVIWLPALVLCACSRMSSLPFKRYLLVYKEGVHPCILVYESTCGDLMSLSNPLLSGTVSHPPFVPSTAPSPMRYNLTHPFGFWLWFIHSSLGQGLYVIAFTSTTHSTHTCSYHPWTQ